MAAEIREGDPMTPWKLGRRFGSLLLLGLVPILAGPGVAAGPPVDAPFSYSLVDEELCAFPIEVAGRGDERIHFSGDTVLFTGSFEVELTNLLTGRTESLTGSGPVLIDQGENTLTIRGKVLAAPAGVPVAMVSGRLSLDAATGRIISLHGTGSIVDPCRLLDPTASPVVPRATPAPWSVPEDTLGGIDHAGLIPISFGIQLHHHAHLDIFIDGTQVIVPAGIGIAEPVLSPIGEVTSAIGGFSPIHTHRDDGILHLEPTWEPLELTLGHLFDVWQVRLTQDCIGGHCADGGSTLRVYRNGVLVAGDPRGVIITAGDEIAVVFGQPGVPADVPSSYDFPPGYPPVVDIGGAASP
jgi:hypothetical protein